MTEGESDTAHCPLPTAQWTLDIGHWTLCMGGLLPWTLSYKYRSSNLLTVVSSFAFRILHFTFCMSRISCHTTLHHTSYVMHLERVSGLCLTLGTGKMDSRLLVIASSDIIVSVVPDHGLSRCVMYDACSASQVECAMCAMEWGGVVCVLVWSGVSWWHGVVCH